MRIVLVNLTGFAATTRTVTSLLANAGISHLPSVSLYVIVVDVTVHYVNPAGDDVVADVTMACSRLQFASMSTGSVVTTEASQYKDRVGLG